MASHVFAGTRGALHRVVVVFSEEPWPAGIIEAGPGNAGPHGAHAASGCEGPGGRVGAGESGVLGGLAEGKVALDNLKSNLKYFFRRGAV